MLIENEIPARRRSLRVPFPVEVVLEGGKQSRFLGYGSNVSETGLFVQCSNPRAVGTHVDLQLHLPTRADGERPVVVKGAGSIVWTRGYHGRTHGAPGMGVHFHSIPVSDLVALRDFCQRYAICPEAGPSSPEASRSPQPATGLLGRLARLLSSSPGPGPDLS